MILLLASLTFAAPECDDLKRDMTALELFLKDKEDKIEDYSEDHEDYIDLI